MSDLEIEEQNLETPSLINSQDQCLIFTRSDQQGKCPDKVFIEEPEEERTNTKKNTTVNGVDFLWKVIGRYDFYIGTINAKAAMIIAFNTLVFSGIILKLQDLIPIGHYKASIMVAVLLTVAAVASLISLWKIFKTINPFLKSPKEPLSNVFFVHVAERQSTNEYLNNVQSLDEKTLIIDLCSQVHSIAQGVKEKFNLLRFITNITLYGQLIPVGLTILIKLYFLINDLVLVGKVGKP